MRQRIETLVHQIWYPAKQKPWFYYVLIGVLLPFSILYRFIIPIRVFYLKHFKQQAVTERPVCVVGNITVGGTGKTPFVIFLAQLLKENGFKPGIVSRGYTGTKAKKDIITLDQSVDVLTVGEEPVLIYERTGCPVVVGCKRNRAILQLCSEFPEVDIIISDDGLQHYAMKRDIEFALLDGSRLCGNSLCLPAGPLREPISRLNTIDYLIIKEEQRHLVLKQPVAEKFSMQFKRHQLHHLRDPNLRLPITDLKGQTVHAVAGIANPQSFFNYLKSQGLQIIEHVFHDHYIYEENDFAFAKNHPIIMTEKDALKCRAITRIRPDLNAWALPVEATLSNLFCTHLLRKLQHG